MLDGSVRRAILLTVNSSKSLIEYSSVKPIMLIKRIRIQISKVRHNEYTQKIESAPENHKK